MDSLDTDLETLENAMRLFFQTMKRPHNWARVTEQSGISLDRPSAVILKLLAASQTPLRVQDLADQLGVEAPSVTRKTQELKRSGYLERLPDATDRRVIDLRITERGRLTAHKLWETQRGIIAEALQGWKPAERQQFVKSFQRFSDDLVAVSAQNTSTK